MGHLRAHRAPQCNAVPRHWRIAQLGSLSTARRRHQLVAGSSAGTATVLLLHPFDVVKTRLQGGSTIATLASRSPQPGCLRCSERAAIAAAAAQHVVAAREPPGRRDAAYACQPAGPPRGCAADLPRPAAPAVQDGALGVLPAYRGPVDAVRQIMRQEGWRAFYAGWWAGLAAAAPPGGARAPGLPLPCSKGQSAGRTGPRACSAGSLLPGHQLPRATGAQCPRALLTRPRRHLRRPGACCDRQRLRLGHVLLLLRGHQRQAAGCRWGRRSCCCCLAQRPRTGCCMLRATCNEGG
jgi:hypothetical protein